MFMEIWLVNLKKHNLFKKYSSLKFETFWCLMSCYVQDLSNSLLLDNFYKYEYQKAIWINSWLQNNWQNYL